MKRCYACGKELSEFEEKDEICFDCDSRMSNELRFMKQ